MQTFHFLSAWQAHHENAVQKSDGRLDEYAGRKAGQRRIRIAAMPACQLMRRSTSNIPRGILRTALYN